jgi:hypothetical protein
MGIFKRKERSYPHLIDLDEYEAELLHDRASGIVLRPVAPVPMALGHPWTERELKAMRRNRDKAAAIYERVKKGQ